VSGEKSMVAIVLVDDGEKAMHVRKRDAEDKV
jgi:hypothetical protein